MDTVDCWGRMEGKIRAAIQSILQYIGLITTDRTRQNTFFRLLIKHYFFFVHLEFFLHSPFPIHLRVTLIAILKEFCQFGVKTRQPLSIKFS